jgi:hypothetical protein
MTEITPRIHFEFGSRHVEIETPLSRHPDPLSTLHDPVILAKTLTGGDELVGLLRVESEHVIVAGNDQPGSDVTGELGGFFAIQVPRDPSLRLVPVDRKQGEVDLELPQLLDKAVVPKRITAVIDRERTEGHDKAHEPAMTGLVSLHRVVCRGDSMETKGADLERLSRIETEEGRRILLQAIGRKGDVRFRKDKPERSARGFVEAAECLRIEVVGVIV